MCYSTALIVRDSGLRIKTGRQRRRRLYLVTAISPREFASEYPRNEEGLILFPSDTQYRKELFPFLILSDHPAKANIYLVQAIVEYVSGPGETIMDIMTGTGTIMTAALIGRRVVCIEIEDEYCSIIEQGIESLERIAPGIGEMITLIPGDCSKVLPVYGVDHIIFSPPYANIMKTSATAKVSQLMKDKGEMGFRQYSKSPDNIGNLNEFLYHQKMELIYKRALESLEPGGTLTIIIKDHMEQGKRVFLGNRAERDCTKAGYELVARYKWLPHGSVFTGIRKGKGDLVVEDEDIIILRRPL